jgi:tetratricopeptide (TPR) repeat protein
MSVEEAKKVSASFGGAAFVPPPRTINDITAILAQQRRTTPDVAARANADEAPSTTDRDTLAAFYLKRGLAAGEIGRTKQEIADLTKALEYARPGGSPDVYEILLRLSQAELDGAKFSRALEHQRKGVEVSPIRWRFRFHADLAIKYAVLGDVNAAEAEFAEAARLYYLIGSSQADRAHLAYAQGALLEATGKYAEAEVSYRRSESILAGDPKWVGHVWLDRVRAKLATTLIRQGRLVEAENEARKALLGALAKRGQYSTHTARILQTLVSVLREQGRYRESERLARADVDIYLQVGADSDSLWFAMAREKLAMALELQGRYQEALLEYDAIQRGLSDAPESLKKFPGGLVGYAEVLSRTGHSDRALERFSIALEQSKRLKGEAHRDTAAIRGALAQSYAANGDTARALHEFREATPILLTRSFDGDEETTRTLADHRLGVMLDSYIGLLADIKSTPLEREAGIDATAEAFRVADITRGRSVQRAITPALPGPPPTAQLWPTSSPRAGRPEANQCPLQSSRQSSEPTG